MLEGNRLALLGSPLKNNITWEYLGISRQGQLDTHHGLPEEECTSPRCPLHEGADRFRQESLEGLDRFTPTRIRLVLSFENNMMIFWQSGRQKGEDTAINLDKQRCNFAVIHQALSIIRHLFML